MPPISELQSGRLMLWCSHENQITRPEHLSESRTGRRKHKTSSPSSRSKSTPNSKTSPMSRRQSSKASTVACVMPSKVVLPLTRKSRRHSPISPAMKVVYTPAALRDLDEIAEWVAVHFPTIAPTIERQIRAVVRSYWALAGERTALTQAPRRARNSRWSLSVPNIFIASRPIPSKSCTSITRRAGLGMNGNDAMTISVSETIRTCAVLIHCKKQA